MKNVKETREKLEKIVKERNFKLVEMPSTKFNTKRFMVYKNNEEIFKISIFKDGSSDSTITTRVDKNWTDFIGV